MGSELLGEIRREIDARLIELQPALEEYQQLLDAAQALDADDAPPPTRHRRTTAKVKATKPASARTPRAVRGAAREAILGALEHGSHTVSELAVVTAMSAANLNGNLRKLFAEGVIAKTQREGKTAWRLSADE